MQWFPQVLTRNTTSNAGGIPGMMARIVRFLHPRKIKIEAIIHLMDIPHQPYK
ncbi:hypothetical protein I4B46_002688 [Enterobacter bugandensis]|nr:hypothetical protein [Enterobacter bugandensis]